MASSAMLTTTATETEMLLAAATEAPPPTTTAGTAAETATATSAVLLENDDDDECKDDDVLNTSLRSCANDPDFAVICAFLQKFAKELGLDLPNFKRLQEWLTNTDEVAAPIRDLHIKLLRKTRKTVHEKSWESAVSKFCFTYSAQDGWEVERFGYKQASLKVKLRILRELLESQFERNNKFRNKILTLSADSLRSQPIGRDRLGHSYWLTQDGDCNLRIYQEHLDEEIWQVVATNRDEFVNLIARLRGNEVVLPSTDIGVIDEDTSSSNSCNVHIEKPPPPVEQDDSQEDEAKVVPNLLLILGEGGAYHSAEKDVGKGEEELAAEEDKKLEQKNTRIQQKIAAKATNEEEEEEEAEEEAEEEDVSAEDEEEEEAEEEEEEEGFSAEEDLSADGVEENDSGLMLKKEQVKNTIPIVAPIEEAQKKVKPLLISQAKIVSSIAVQHAVLASGTTKKRPLDEVGKTSPRSSDDNTNAVKKFRPSLLDSKRDKKPSKYEKVKSDEEDDDDDEDVDDDDDDEGSEEEDEADIDDDEGEEEDIDSAAAEEDENEEKDIEEDDDDDEDDEVGEAIADPPIIVRGEGSGKQCDGANPEFLTEFSLLDDITIFLYQDEDPEPEVGEAIEEEYLYISGEGNGAECLVGNKNNEEPPSTPPATTTSTSTEPKATFFFGEPGCLKLSPIKKSENKDTDATSNEEETLEELTDIRANNKVQQNAELEAADKVELTNSGNSDKNEEKNKVKNNQKFEEHNHENSNKKIEEKICEKNSEIINTEKSDKINESLNKKKDEMFEAIEVNAKKDNTMNENANHNCESNIKENTMLEKETNKIEINNKFAEQPMAEESKVARIAETNVKIIELNGIGNNEVHTKNKENQEITKMTEAKTEVQQTTNAKEALEVTEKADENNSTIVKASEESLEKLHKTEIMQRNDQENLNLVPNKEDSTNSKTVIKILTTDLPEIEANKSSGQTTEKLIKPKSTDKHLTLNEAFNKTSKVADSDDPQTLKQTVTISQKCALPEKTAAEDAPTTAAAAFLTNRKRRLADFAEKQKPKMHQQTTSESEIDLPEEPVKGAANDELEDDAEYVGGKRLKMRAKLTNTEIRKKVEAKKIAAVEETTSSSGEEEALRKRKIISPKRQLITNKSNKIELSKNLEKETRATLAEIKEEVTVPVVAPLPVKQKPTLAEIIEKKLKKTPEKPVKIQAVDAYALSDAATITASSSSTEAILKKSPIAKPLKKNLLTQLRQDESDEEAIPRKRIIGETTQQIIERPQNTPPTGQSLPSPLNQKLAFDEQQKVEQLARATPERITPDRQRKRRSSEEVQNPEFTDYTPNADCVGEKLKKNDANETASIVQELKVESVPLAMNRLESTQEEDLFKQETSAEIGALEIAAKTEAAEGTTLDRKPEVKEEEVATALSGRRSGRRGGAAVIYAELPQPKRTRGGPKSTPAAAALPKQEETKLKIETTETKPNKETLPETTKPQDKPEAKKPATTESKEVKSEDEDSPETDAKKNPTTPKPAKTPPKARGRKKREVDTTNIIDTADSETPVRQSRRIAQQKIREEAERRKLEEIALRTMKNELKKKKKAEAQADPSVPEPSEQSSSSDESEASEIEETKKLKKKKCPGKDGTWSSGSEEQEEPEEEEEPPHYETDPGSPLFRSDHEFSPESDLEDESQVVPMKRARTARKEDAEISDLKRLDQEEEACQKCGKSDHPEWILLCDSCDKGYHCSCLSPVLFYIPEGDWYCPPCQQEQLIAALEKQLQEFDFLVKQKRIEEELAQRLAEEAVRAENERLEEEKRKKKKKKQRTGDDSSDNDADQNASAARKGDKRSDGDDDDDDEDDDEKTLKYKDKKAKKNQSNDKRKQRREVGGHRRRRRRAATRGARRRRRNASKSAGSGDSNSGGSGSQSGTDSESSSDGSSSSSTATDSDDEPIYKLRKRRQINVSYRLNEYDDLINSALRKEMDEAAYAGNLGRGKDITTIIEADKEEQARQKQLVDGELVDVPDLASTEGKTATDETKIVPEDLVVASSVAEIATKANVDEQKTQVPEDVDSEEEPLKRKAKTKQTLKKKPRKLTTLDISSEEDNASDEDFKGSSLDDEDDEDTSVSVSSNSDSSLEIYRRRGKKGGKKKTRKAARRTARERRKVRKFVVDDSDDDEEEEARPKTKKKRKTDSDYTESEESGDLSELSENMDSADLCDDSSSSEDSDGAWRPSKRKKQRKSTAVNIARKSPKLKKPQTKKPKRVEYSDDDVSEEEEEDYEDEDDDPATGGKGSGKQPRTVPLKPSNSGKGKGKGKGGAGAGKSSKTATASKKKKKKLSDYEDNSFSDSEDSTRRTRGRRYAYLEDFEDDSSDGGIKPGVKRPDTPPEEREKFIKKQEEIKRMLAEKNSEGAKLAATPRLTPIKGGTRSPAKPGDSLSTVPLSVIRQAKVLDIDYLQRKGESVSDVDNVDDVDSEFDDADLPDDFPEDMDEDAIARMVEEEEEFGAAAATRELPTPDEVLKPAPAKSKPKDAEKPQVPPGTNASLAALSQMPSNAGSGQTTIFASGLQEPMRKRLPMPTMHPPLLRHQYPGGGQHHHSLPPHMMQRHAGPPTHLLQNALSAPLGQPVHRNFPQHTMGAQRGPPGGGMPPRHVLPPHALPPPQQQLNASHPLTGSAGEAEAKPRGRRKKITPLRDPLQKQQAAAAATAAAAVQAASAGNASEKRETSPPTSVATGVIKTATSLAIAQPPQLFKPTAGSSSTGQPSVITRMPHMPHGAPPGRGMPHGPPGMYAGGDVARFYGPPMQQPSGAPGSRMPPASSQRHRGPPHVGSMPPHHGMRPSYGPPPPLRGVIGSSNQPPSNSVSGTRPPYPPPPNRGDHHGPQSSGPYGPPPPARHAAPHINPYRPSIFGNPNYGPRGAQPGASMRSTGPPGQEYPSGPPRSYAPYGYYPPPPPLTAAHPPPPSSSHPPPSSSTTHAPPTSKPSPSTTRTSTSNTQPPAVPSSVIVSAPPSAISLTPSAAAAQKHAPRAVIKTAPSAAGANKSTPTATVSPSVVIEPRKKLITLETFATSKSPLALSGESSGSRSSPNVQTDGADDSTSTTAVAASGGNGQGASEFSGLVSYFSSQHDDYNT